MTYRARCKRARRTRAMRVHIIDPQVRVDDLGVSVSYDGGQTFALLVPIESVYDTITGSPVYCEVG